LLAAEAAAAVVGGFHVVAVEVGGYKKLAPGNLVCS
jgi:hypothetical protein